MGIYDILILIVVAAAVFGAVWTIRKKKKNGSACCGSCSACIKPDKSCHCEEGEPCSK